MTNLPSLQSIDIGDDSFPRVTTFTLNGLNDLKNEYIDLSKLQSVKIGNDSLYYSLELNNLPSLQFIDIGENCFYYAPSFSLTGRIDGLVWINRSTSTTISQIQ